MAATKSHQVSGRRGDAHHSSRQERAARPENRRGRNPVQLGFPRRHIDLLTENYRRAKFFDAYAPALCALLETRHRKLADLTIATSEWLAQVLGITARRIRSVTLKMRARKLIYLCICADSLARHAMFRRSARMIIWTFRCLYQGGYRALLSLLSASDIPAALSAILAVHECG